ncbi:MAG: hypothetical protein AB7J28_16125 [Hyphomonadaceae bacterium]
MNLRVFIAVIAAFVAIGGFAMQAEAQLGNLTGEWRGTYYGAGNAATDFEIDLSQSGRNLNGTIVERRVQPQNGYHWLISTLRGTTNATTVSFVKTYTDPAAGMTHTVNYRGTLSDGGRRIRGTWYLDGAQGQFEMVR